MSKKASSTAQPLFTSPNRIKYQVASRTDYKMLREDADYFFGTALKLLKDFAYEIDDERADGILTLFEMSYGARTAADELRRAAME